MHLAISNGHRTQEEIDRQLKARLAEMEAEAAAAAKVVDLPCAQCRWRDSFYKHECAQPLVTGLSGKALPNVDWQLERWDGVVMSNWPSVALCGPEKALWEETPVKMTRWQRFVNWLLG